MQYRPCDLDDIDTTYDAVARLHYAVQQLANLILDPYERLFERLLNKFK